MRKPLFVVVWSCYLGSSQQFIDPVNRPMLGDVRAICTAVLPSHPILAVTHLEGVGEIPVKMPDYKIKCGKKGWVAPAEPFQKLTRVMSQGLRLNCRAQLFFQQQPCNPAANICCCKRRSCCFLRAQTSRVVLLCDHTGSGWTSGGVTALSDCLLRHHDLVLMGMASAHHAGSAQFDVADVKCLHQVVKFGALCPILVGYGNKAMNWKAACRPMN